MKFRSDQGQLNHKSRKGAKISPALRQTKFADSKIIRHTAKNRCYDQVHLFLKEK